MKCKCQIKSCLCYSLEHGAIIIGITFMLSSAIGLMLYVGMLLQWDEIKLNFNDKRMRQCMYNSKNLLNKPKYELKYSIFFSVVKPFLIVNITLSSVYIIFSVLLLKGIKEVLLI